MTRLFASILLLIGGLVSSAQAPWVSESYRNMTYPPSEYYVSYLTQINEGNLDDCISKTLTGVQSMLANSIYSEVSSVSKSTTSTINKDGNYTETETFANEFRTAASAKLVNVNIEHYYNKSTNTVHALAFVKKQDLSDFCENKLKTGLSSVDQKLKTIDEFLAQGYKSEAKDLVHKTMKEIVEYPMFITQLINVGLSKENPATYSTHLENAQKQLIRLKSDLEHGMSICMNTVFNSSVLRSEILSGKCKGVLSNNGCSFVTDPSSADFSVKLDYTTRTSSNSDAGCFAFADVNITIKRIRDNSVIFDDYLSAKGGGGTEDKAHRKAVEQLSKQVCEKILSTIK